MNGDSIKQLRSGVYDDVEVVVVVVEVPVLVADKPSASGKNERKLSS